MQRAAAACVDALKGLCDVMRTQQVGVYSAAAAAAGLSPTYHVKVAQPVAQHDSVVEHAEKLGMMLPRLLLRWLVYIHPQPQSV